MGENRVAGTEVGQGSRRRLGEKRYVNQIPSFMLKHGEKIPSTETRDKPKEGGAH